MIGILVVYFLPQRHLRHKRVTQGIPNERAWPFTRLLDKGRLL